jgi:hypothetical protein
MHSGPMMISVLATLVFCEVQLFARSFVVRPSVWRPRMHHHLSLATCSADSYRYDMSSNQFHSFNFDNENDPSSPLAVTWRWCRDFVVPLQLCPWAAASVNTPGAIQFYVVPVSSNDVTGDQLVQIVEIVARQFRDRILIGQGDKDVDHRKVAIAFIVLANTAYDATSESTSWIESFPSFYEWFTQFEDDWIDEGLYSMTDDEEEATIYDAMTLAAFHPDWEYENGAIHAEDSSTTNGLDFEKKSPFPTLTLVSTETIDAAGPEVTERIAQQNARVLQAEMTLEQLQKLYQQAVWRCKSETD